VILSALSALVVKKKLYTSYTGRLNKWDQRLFKKENFMQFRLLKTIFAEKFGSFYPADNKCFGTICSMYFYRIPCENNYQ
jgi:hypothetical protein